ncbi:MAG: HAD family phosphatase [Rhodoferax sp.]|nr:HAD family phosphatase [Rhodoferax sp.]MBP7572699.1 HAD family phosphatase [Rhodoferax sp.]MBP8135332.1 HAD family phosphatase [Rhodoferax sp.]
MKFEAVLFDCDGVLVDSEHITNGVLRDMLQERGWNLTVAECMSLFVGKTVRDEAELIEQRTGSEVTEDWLTSFRDRRNEALSLYLTAIPDIHDAVHRVHAHHGGRIACASGADRFKVELMLRKLELISYFDGRIFSGYETPRSKPFPDVYLAAAAALGVDPRRCAVVEDTVVGVTAGVAAGSTVFAYSPATSTHVDAQDLLQAGAHHIFTRMTALPDLLAQQNMTQLTFT